MNDTTEKERDMSDLFKQLKMLWADGRLEVSDMLEVISWVTTEVPNDLEGMTAAQVTHWDFLYDEIVAQGARARNAEISLERALLR